MKLLKWFSGGILLYFLLFSTTTQFTACVKKETIHDTVKVIVLDSSGCFDLKDGLVAYYNFKGGNLNDSSGKNNHISFNNAVKTADRFGKPDGAYVFNGTSSYMQVPNHTTINPASAITLMAIVKVNGFYMGTCHVNQIFGENYEDYVNGYYALRFSDYGQCNDPVNINKEIFTGAYGNSGGGAGTFAGTDTPVVKTGQWYTVTYTYEGGLSKLYVNGVLKDSRQQVVSFTPNNYDLFIGKGHHPQFPYWFNGIIDEIRIYNKALCGGAVKQLHTQKE